METLVLCPEELCLGPSRVQMPPPVPGFPMLTGQAGGSDYSIWTTGDLEKGTRFLPWKGTVRSDKLPVHDKLPEFDVSTQICYYLAKRNNHKVLISFLIFENAHNIY